MSQEKMFRFRGKVYEVDENGNYEKEIGNFIMKKLPNAGITAGLGLVGGTLLGSPILGLIAGSAVGFAGQSESVKKRLFGDIDPETGERSKGGLINKELRDRIKKAAPNIAAGGIAGLLVGPFGIAGNMVDITLIKSRNNRAGKSCRT